LSITPMIRIGYGIKDDDIPFYVGSVENGQPVQYQPSAKIEVDHFYGLQVRGEFQLNSKAYLFVERSYSWVETKLSVNYRCVGLDFPDFSESYDKEGFGIGAGAGLRFNDLISVELSYEIADLGDRVDMKSLSALLRFSF